MYVQESRSRLVRKNKQIVTTTIKAGQENKQTNLLVQTVRFDHHAWSTIWSKLKLADVPLWRQKSIKSIISDSTNRSPCLQAQSGRRTPSKTETKVRVIKLLQPASSTSNFYCADPIVPPSCRQLARITWNIWWDFTILSLCLIVFHQDLQRE